MSEKANNVQKKTPGELLLKTTFKNDSFWCLGCKKHEGGFCTLL